MANDNPTKIPEMVKRCAWSLCALHGEMPDDLMPAVSGPGWRAPAQPKWMNYVPQVRVVLRRMREPTEAMLEASVIKSDPDSDTVVRIGPFLNVWQAMIDAALEE